MRIACLLLVLLLPQMASAASLPFTGTLRIAFQEGVSLPVATGSGVAEVDGDAVSFGAGIFSYQTSVPVLGATPITGFTLDGSAGAASFGPGGGVFPLAGSLVLCGLAQPGGCGLPLLTVPLTQNGTRGVGIGGPAIQVSGLTTVSLLGAPFTLDFVDGPLGPGGSLQLVSPVVFSSNAVESLPFSAVLDLSFVPEPALALLLGAAALWAARRVPRG